ncbi:MAG TPA: cytochrome c oxidase assembly protein [Casimicrobiaceae bacterium]|nr:cytochrome c oxidase assembly protein [Casimicrobiaceae bacterium]
MVHRIRRARLPLVGAAALIVAPVPAWAHSGAHPWGEPWVLTLVIAAALGYGVGLARLWRHAAIGSGITLGQASAYGGGSLLLAAALCSPLDGLASELFAVHMIQHELLMVAAAPLLVLGRPLATWTWALSPHARVIVGCWTRQRDVAHAWQALTHPLSAFLIHAAALWLWHVPVLFDAALRNEAVHALQHASFLFSALLFWWAVLQPADARVRGGVAVLYLFGTMLHTGALGALLTVSTAPWYLAATDPAWGVSAIEDQQIGGLIMWIPAGTVYVFAALWVMARWLAHSGTRIAAPIVRKSVSASGR